MSFLIQLLMVLLTLFFEMSPSRVSEAVQITHDAISSSGTALIQNTS